MTTQTEKECRIHEQGNGFGGVKTGARIYDGSSVVRIVDCASAIHTSSAGDYVHATVVSDADAGELSQEEWDALPPVRVTYLERGSD